MRQQLAGEVVAIPSDASDAPSQKDVAEAIRQAFGKIDILFLNAGVVELKPVELWDEAGFDRSFATNVKGPFFLIQALLPVFARRRSC